MATNANTESRESASHHGKFHAVKGKVKKALHLQSRVKAIFQIRVEYLENVPSKLHKKPLFIIWKKGRGPRNKGETEKFKVESKKLTPLAILLTITTSLDREGEELKSKPLTLCLKQAGKRRSSGRIELDLSTFAIPNTKFSKPRSFVLRKRDGSELPTTITLSFACTWTKMNGKPVKGLEMSDDEEKKGEGQTLVNVNGHNLLVDELAETEDMGELTNYSLSETASFSSEDLDSAEEVLVENNVNCPEDYGPHDTEPFIGEESDTPKLGQTKADVYEDPKDAKIAKLQKMVDLYEERLTQAEIREREVEEGKGTLESIYQAKIKEKESLILELQEKLVKLQKEIPTHGDALTTEKILTLDTEIKDQRNEISELNDKIGSLKEKLKRRKKHLAHANQKVLRLEEEIELLKGAVVTPRAPKIRVTEAQLSALLPPREIQMKALQVVIVVEVLLTLLSFVW